MKKIILALILAAAPLGCAFAQIADPGWFENDPVDYRRLQLPTDEPAIPCFYTLEFGKAEDHTVMMGVYLQRTLNEVMATDKMTVAGQLIRTWNITPEYIEACIQKALETSRIHTRAELARMIAETPAFRDFTYTEKQWLNDMFGLVSGTIGFFVPSGTISTIYGATTGAAGLVFSNATGSAGTVDNVLGTAGIASSVIPGNISGGAGNLLSAAQMFKTIYDQYGRDIQKWDNRTALLNMCRIDYFYNLVNMYLRSYAGTYDSIWVMAFPEISRTMPFQYRGVLCQANWHFRLGAIKLQWVESGAAPLVFSDFEGEYFGFLNGDVNFDLSNYDSHYRTSVDPNYVGKAGGKTDNPFINMAEKMKAVVPTDEIRGNINGYAMMPDLYDLTEVIDVGGTDMWATYDSPLHITVQVNDHTDDRMLETSPHYFWDYYEELGNEKELRASGVMRAMGISVGKRDAEVKVGASLEKGYTAVEKIIGTVDKMHEKISGDKYTIQANNYTETVSVKEYMSMHEVPVTIPGGMLRVLWTSEIEPPKCDNPRETTEKQWGEMLRKYGLVFKY